MEVLAAYEIEEMVRRQVAVAVRDALAGRGGVTADQVSEIVNRKAADPKSVDAEIGRRLTNAITYHELQYHHGQKKRFPDNGPGTLNPELRTMTPDQLAALGGSLAYRGPSPAPKRKRRPAAKKKRRRA